MTEQDKIRLVGELVTVVGAVIMLLLEVSAGGVWARPPAESPPAELSLHGLVFCFTRLPPDPGHLQGRRLSLFWTDRPWGAVPCHHVSVPSFQPELFPVSLGPGPQGTLSSRASCLQEAGRHDRARMCVLDVKTKPERVGTAQEAALRLPALLIPCSPLSPQHRLRLPGAADHGDAAHRHQRGGGAPVPRPGAGLVQCHVLRPRLPDAGPLQHHDPEGRFLPLSSLWPQPLDLPSRREGVEAERVDAQRGSGESLGTSWPIG